MSDNEEKTKRIVHILEQVKKEDTTINFVMPMIFSKKVASYMLIEEDILHAKEAIETLLSLKEGDKKADVLKISLWRSAISSYGKCFNSNKGGYSVLNAECFAGHDALKDIHDNLMLLRNSYVSHRDDTEHENVVVIMKIPKEDGADLSKIECRLKSLITATPSVQSLKESLQVIHHLLPITRQKIEHHTQRAYEGFVDFLKDLPKEHLKYFHI